MTISVMADAGCRAQQMLERQAVILSNGRLRQMQWILLLLGLAAAVLTAMGIYGAFSFNLGRRTREMGVRIAMGASHSEIYLLCARAAGGAVGGGLLAGVCLYALLASAMHRLMAGSNGPAIPFSSPVALLGALALVATAALIAGWRPAWRATRTDPVAALREE